MIIQIFAARYVRVLEGINKLARTFTWTSLHLTCDDHLGECDSKKESALHRWLPTISQSFDNIWYAMPVPQNMPPPRKDSAQFSHLSSLCKQRIIMISILCRKLTYCWWTKSCTTKDDEYPIIYKVLTIPGGAGFCPSTVFPLKGSWEDEKKQPSSFS